MLDLLKDTQNPLSPCFSIVPSLPVVARNEEANL